MSLLTEVSATDFPRIMQVWEASVRATHDFLTLEHLDMLRPIVLEKALPAVTLRATRNQDSEIIGFLGVDGRKLEMLFLDPAERGKGLGRRMLEQAIADFDINEVDVNEQNEQALGFYQRMNFEIVGRSETDGLGLPYPLLHLELR